MTNKDIVDMYNKGVSLDFIVNSYYKYKTRNDIPDHKFNNQFIITKKSISIDKARHDVEDIILKFALSNKAN